VQGYHLYEIGSEETVSSIVHKLQNTVESLVFLRISQEALSLFNEDNLRLLAHYSRKENKMLVLLTRNEEIKELAEKLRLTTADSVEAFLSVPGINVGEEIKKTKSPKMKVKQIDEDKKEPNGSMALWAKKTVVAASVIFVVLFVLQWGLRYWFLPKVTVMVYPRLATTDTEITIPLSSLNTEKEIVELKKVFSVPATGSKIVGTQRASGEVVLFNQGQKQLKLYKDTKIKAKDGKIYLVTQDVLIPGAEVVYVLDVRSSQTSGQALAFVEALELGEEYNAQAGELTTLVGDFPNITVRNIKPISGGKSEKRPVVTASDIEKAKQGAIDLLLQEAIKAKPYEYLVDSSEQRTEPEVIVDNKVDSFSPTVTATASQIVSINKVSQEEIKRQAELVLKDIGMSQYSLVNNSIRIYDAVLQDDAFRISLGMDLYPTLTPQEVAQTIAGKTKEQAIEIIQEKGDISIEGLKGEELPARKQWIKVVVLDEYESDKTKTKLSFNQLSSSL